MGRQKKKGGKAGKVQSQHCTTCAESDSRHPHHTRTKQKEKEVVELGDSDDEPLGQPKKKRRKAGKVQSQHCTTCAVSDSRHPHHTRTKQEEKEAVGSDDEGTCDTCAHTNTVPHDRAHAEEQKSRKSKKCKPAKKGKAAVLSDSDQGI